MDIGGQSQKSGVETRWHPVYSWAMLAEEYFFDTEKEEHITVTIGGFEIRPLGEDWKKVETVNTVMIAANSRFHLKVKKPASYTYMYK